MDYISESMGHSSSEHAITQIYIEHYPLEIQMENDSKLLNLEESSAKGCVVGENWQVCPRKNWPNCLHDKYDFEDDKFHREK